MSSPQYPRTYLDNEDIRCVAFPYASPSSSEGISTPVLSAEMKHVLLERLQKEIISKLGSRSMCRSRGASGRSLSGKKRRRAQNNDEVGNEKVDASISMSPAESVVRSRFIVGINQCTRILQLAFKQQKEGQNQQGLPSLILLARDVRPATILAHISLYAKLLNIPTLILPGKASVELGKAVGIRSVAVAAFISSPSGECSVKMSGGDKQTLEREWKETQNDVDSFVKYAISKIPK